MSLLAASGIEAGYGQMRVLTDVRFEVEEGEFLGILGHNGMGKSTLLKALCGEIPLTRGAIAFADRDVGKLAVHARARAGIGYVPQGRQIFPALTVRENMLMAALGSGRPATVADRVLAKFPRLQPIVDRAGGVLSGGEQQILALARCLCGEPKLLLLDEPTEGVQPSIRDEISDTLLRLRRDFGLTLLLVEQNIQFMQSLADRVLHMEKGRVSAGHDEAAGALAF
ncbi:ABC transporter ATP-binding protein [Chelatococcus reniformis]|uniref:ABC transporter ATP-binding protein n=1 Tax=Chelatococcus reniformis TaxID=1494448 RepID=A0A916XMK5_9HYPH|nr:ABC transporter ATP-binding protein [Chelatococcus reniformis]GGC87130.1 ABC transporter ATP-binding protein [Chelatococcus reniformis]